MVPVGSGLVLAIVPTYNERENIRQLVGELRALPINVHVVIVDDNSPDGTGAIADDMAAADNDVYVLHRSGKLGLGTAYKAGFDYGLSRGYQGQLWLLVIGVHVVPDYRAEIDYANL